VYWLNLFLQILYKFTVTGDTEDTQNKAEFKEDEKIGTK